MGSGVARERYCQPCSKRAPLVSSGYPKDQAREGVFISVTKKNHLQGHALLCGEGWGGGGAGPL